MTYAIIAIVLLLLDQFTKFWVERNVALNTGIRELIPGVLHITNIHNEGAALGLFQNSRWLLLGVLAVFTIVVIILLWRRVVHTVFGRLCLVLLLAGALGNGLDRAIFGYVVDMFELEFMRFAVFNVADAVMNVCVALFILWALFHKEKKDGA